MNKAIRCAALLLTFCVIAAVCKQGYGPGEQDWGFVDVRRGAHMFYWLYYTTADVDTYTERPLAIWLQGGPGGSSTGYGNIEEIGPWDLYGEYRETTWVKDMNVLFIDNPVGSGFSYVDGMPYYTATNKEIAEDLVEFMKQFYELHPEFKTVPLHIFSQSYGGKMAPEFALELYYAIQRGEVESNLQSVQLGAPWTSPIDSVLAWGPMLLQFGLVDHDGYNQIMAETNFTLELVQQERWLQSTYQWANTQYAVLRATKGVDFYNVLQKTLGNRYLSQMALSPEELLYRTMVTFDIDEDRTRMLQDLMRGPVAQALGIPSYVVWGSQSNTVFDVHRTDFMKPAVHIVNELLDNTPVKVAAVSGNLDLICATSGTVNWIDKLDWSKRSEYLAAPRNGISVDRVLEGYQKTGGNFTMYWINRSGHSIPAENPAGFSHVLQQLTNFGG